MAGAALRLPTADCRLPIRGFSIGDCRFGLTTADWIGDCRLDWRLPIGLAIADWIGRLPFGLADCRLHCRLATAPAAEATRGNPTSDFNRHSKSSMDNRNRQSTIGNRQSAI